MNYSESVFQACRASDQVFVLHPRFERANFYAQQVRVLHLLIELVKQDIVHPVKKREIGIIGGGIAGLTAAAGALSMGLGVRLFDPKENLLSQYNQAIHREIHPNIISWPFNQLRAVTNLPFLNWGFAPANKVAEKIRTQWKEHIERHTKIIPAKVISVEDDDGGAIIKTENEGEFNVHAAILTVGFEREKLVEGCDSTSYWTPRVCEGNTPVWISGIGDGGLIDVACQTYGLDATKVARELAYCLDEKPQKNAILYAEQEALRKYLAGDQEGSVNDLGRFYSMLGIEPEDIDQFQNSKIPDVAPANLIHRRVSPYSPLSCPINKVLVSVMAEGGNPEVVMYRGSVERTEDGSIILKTETDEVSFDTRRCFIRHGADHAVWELLTETQKIRLDDASKSTLAEPVPDFIYDEWKELFSERQLIPDEWYADYLYQIIREILASAGCANVEINRDNSSNEWKVQAADIKSRGTKGIFPIEMGEIRVSLTDTPNAEFTAI